MDEIFGGELMPLWNHIYNDLTTERPKELKPKVDVIKITNEVELQKPLVEKPKSFYDKLR